MSRKELYDLIIDKMTPQERSALLCQLAGWFNANDRTLNLRADSATRCSAFDNMVADFWEAVEQLTMVERAVDAVANRSLFPHVTGFGRALCSVLKFRSRMWTGKLKPRQVIEMRALPLQQKLVYAHLVRIRHLHSGEFLTNCKFLRRRYKLTPQLLLACIRGLQSRRLIAKKGRPL